MRTEMVLDPWVGHRSSNLARLADLTGLENRSSMHLVILNYAYTDTAGIPSTAQGFRNIKRVRMSARGILHFM